MTAPVTIAASVMANRTTVGARMRALIEPSSRLKIVVRRLKRESGVGGSGTWLESDSGVPSFTSGRRHGRYAPPESVRLYGTFSGEIAQALGDFATLQSRCKGAKPLLVGHGVVLSGRIRSPDSSGFAEPSRGGSASNSARLPALRLQPPARHPQLRPSGRSEMNPELSRNASHLKVAALAAAAFAALNPAAALGQQLALDVPLPPPPPGLKQVPVAESAPQSPPAAAPAARSSTAPGERCMSCHAAVAQKPVLHPSLEKNDCTVCHTPAIGQSGKCRSQSASKWTLKKQEPELCYDCHARKDQSKNVHTAVRQGSCLSCHTPHSSNFKGLLNEPPQTVCMTCHEVEPLLTKAVRHAPVAEGRCLDCHSPHGSDAPFAIRSSGNAFCLKCHDSKAPLGQGSPGPAYRLDMSKPVVHAALTRGDCGQCHEIGHSGDNLKLLKKSAVDTCYGCHPRKDKDRFPHSAVVVGDCAVCHAPHTSDQPKLLAKATINETCFLCHQDDVTMRKVVHPPVKKSCMECHGAHGAPNRSVLKAGEGKKQCYACHQPVDKGKNKHAALERYGCVGCHDPHGTAYGRRSEEHTSELQSPTN